MHTLEGNPFINWKYLDITYKGEVYKAKVRAFECSLCNDGIAYHVKFTDKDLVFGYIGEKWHQLNNPTEFAQVAGNAIGTRVNKVMNQYFEEHRPKRLKAGEIGPTWGKKFEG